MAELASEHRSDELLMALASRHIEAHPEAARRHSFACRQITRLDEKSAHQTQIITTRSDPDPSLVVYAMFSRWRQENFFRYKRAHFGLDALDAYETEPDDLGRLVANPVRRDADRASREGRRQLTEAEAEEGSASLDGRKAGRELIAALRDARAEVARLEAVAKAVPARVPLGDIRPDAVRLDIERKRIMDAIRMATYNAESALAGMIAPHYARAEDEARSLLREIFKSPADLEIQGDKLHVRILPLSGPRRTKAMAALCEELTATETLYPGTDLVIVYSVKAA